MATTQLTLMGPKIRIHSSCMIKRPLDCWPRTEANGIWRAKGVSGLETQKVFEKTILPRQVGPEAFPVLMALEFYMPILHFALHQWGKMLKGRAKVQPLPSEELPILASHFASLLY